MGGDHALQPAESVGSRVKRSAIPPRKTPGDKAIDDGTIDFENAVVGERDESKLSIDYNTTRRDPNNHGNTISGDRVQNRYRETVDFNDENSVRRLNAWRSQILRRNFPDRRKKSLHPWLQSEMETVLGLIREQMKARRTFRWTSVANSYNREMSATTQKAGEKLFKGGNRKVSVLKRDRQTPWRTASSIIGATTKWQEYRDLMDEYLPLVEEDENDANQEDFVETEDDEEEIPEPGPGPSN